MDIQTWDVLCVLVCRMYLHVDIDGESEIQKRSKKLCNVKEQTDERKGTFITNVVSSYCILAGKNSFMLLSEHVSYMYYVKYMYTCTFLTMIDRMCCHKGMNFQTEK